MAEPKTSPLHLEQVRHGEAAREETLEALRHNGTHTVPPGVRAGWLAKPLPRLTEEHLQATDELDSDRLPNASNPRGGDEPRIPLNRLLTPRFLLSTAALLAVIGASILFRRLSFRVDQAGTLEIRSATPFLAVAPSEAPRPVASQVPPHGATPAPSASMNVTTASVKSTKLPEKASTEKPAARGAASPRGGVKQGERQTPDNNDEPLFAPH